MANPPLYGFGPAPADTDYPLEAIEHYSIAGHEDQWWDSVKRAHAEFTQQLLQIPLPTGHYLFLRKPPTLLQQNGQYKVVARFSLMKLKPPAQTPRPTRHWQGLTPTEIHQFSQWAHPDIIETIETKLKDRNL